MQAQQIDKTSKVNHRPSLKAIPNTKRSARVSKQVVRPCNKAKQNEAFDFVGVAG